MRLINTKTGELKEHSVDIPPYAILSHTWGDGEVSFADWGNLNWLTLVEAREKEGFRKIELACKQAVKDNFDYAWVDTNCIDKTSSSELSEAINSMFAWYRDAQVCYVFLKDVSVPDDVQQEQAAKPPEARKYIDHPAVKRAFQDSLWFRRGWTLQELLAPAKVVFYSYEWLPLGTKDDNKRLISGVTGIDYDYLTQPNRVYTATVARRMSWAARRKTTRIEDTAYCLLGIFGIHMALLYGERHRAFLRLQEEIIRVSNDQTIFCWQGSTIGNHNRQTVRHLHDDPELYGNSSADAIHLDKHRRSELEHWTSILAPHPSVFRSSTLFLPAESSTNASAFAAGEDHAPLSEPRHAQLSPYSITNFGLSIALPLLYTARGACVVLDAVHRKTSRAPLARVVVALHRLESGHYVRLSPRLIVTEIPAPLLKARTQLFIDCRNTQASNAMFLLSQRNNSRPINLDVVGNNPVAFLTFNEPIALGSTALVSAGMEFMSFHSVVEVSDYRPGVRGAVILEVNKHIRSKSYLLFAGQSSSRSHNASDDPATATPIPHLGSGPGVNMHWLVDLFRKKEPPGWTAEELRDILDPMPDDFFGSWCQTTEIKNVLSWHVSPRGALFLHLEVNKLKTRPVDGVQPAEEDLGRFNHLREVALHSPNSVNHGILYDYAPHQPGQNHALEEYRW